MITYEKKASECSVDELRAFMALVIQADEVDPEGFEGRLKRAERLIFIFEAEELIGIAAIKRPSMSYIKRVFEKAQFTGNPNSFVFELGWIVIKEHFRGQRLSRVLMEKALQCTMGHKVFATTRADNIAMQKTNERYGFHIVGKRYPTSRVGRHYYLNLFINEAA